MLLAAGLGTRLQPLTELRPKPIVPVANRPLAAFAMDHLARCGVGHIVANTHPRPELVEAELEAACPPGVQLRFSRETALLGTGGGVRNAQRWFEDASGPVIVANGDIVFGPDLVRAYAEHASRGAVATMILRRTPDAGRFGAIGIDAEGWVRSLLGAPPHAPTRETLMFTGVHILAPEAFADLPESGCIIRSAYRTWVDRGAPVLGIVDDSPWADLGTVPDYHRLNLEIASGSFSWPGVERCGDCILPASMTISARIRHSVIGEDVVIEDGVSLERCVVWPGTTVERSAAGAILTPKHRIAVS